MKLARVLIAALAALESAAGQSQAPKAIPDEPSCQRCTITMRTLVTLGTDDGVGSLNGRPMSRCGTSS